MGTRPVLRACPLFHFRSTSTPYRHRKWGAAKMGRVPNFLLHEYHAPGDGLALGLERVEVYAGRHIGPRAIGAVPDHSPVAGLPLAVRQRLHKSAGRAVDRQRCVAGSRQRVSVISVAGLNGLGRFCDSARCNHRSSLFLSREEAGVLPGFRSRG